MNCVLFPGTTGPCEEILKDWNLLLLGHNPISRKCPFSGKEDISGESGPVVFVLRSAVDETDKNVGCRLQCPPDHRLSLAPCNESVGIHNSLAYRGMSMQAPHRLFVVLLLAASLGLETVSAFAVDNSSETHLVARGRYLAQVSGCNDCHTDGYLTNNGNVPVSQWLKGSRFGWHGPWGTTYASNLRLFMKDMSEADWIKAAHSLTRRPPMPWYNLNAMHDDDLRALYYFVRSLGDPGEPAPAYLPPGEEPHTAYASFPAPPKAK